MKHDTAASQRKHTPTGGQPAPDGTVVLKKYGNRRLYDTSSSRYVTIGEVEAMVQGGTDIQVKDAKTGEDITKEILVQLLLERDSARAALPTGLLKQAVRLANSPLKEGLVKAMQEGLDTFMQSQRTIADAQRALSSQLGQLTPWLQPTTTPAALWNPFAPPAPPPPGTMTSQPLSTPVSAPAAPPSPMAPPVMPHAAATNGDVDTLRAELSQTQALVRQLLERELAREQPVTPLSAPSTSAKKAPKKAATKAATAKKAVPAKATARKR